LSQPEATPRFLYMPMEIASRELDSRLLIVLFACREGIEVVTGQKWLLQKNAGQMPSGIWIFKTVTPGDANQMLRIRALGHRISAIDEEMPGLGEGAGRLRWVDKRSVAASEAIFCLGSRHIQAMTDKFPNCSHKLVETGNPRWDFLRPELRAIYDHDANAIREKYGKSILVNTNIGLMNSAKNTADALIKSLTSDGRINLGDPVDREFIDSLKIFEAANFAAAIPLVRRLRDEFPDHNVILRPHPTEKIEPYQDALTGESRILIVREGPAAAWLAACDVLVHTSCTTATEAFALGRPSVCFQTVPSMLHTHFLSGALSNIATSEDGVIAIVRQILDGKWDRSNEPQQRAYFEKFFAAQHGAFAAQRIASFMAKALAHGDAKASGEAQWKPGALFRQTWYPSKFQQRIFPKLTEAQVIDRLQLIAKIVGIGDVPHVSVCGDGQYHIYPKSLGKKKHRRRLLPF
jgi:surface carbohydrate biosynthesis protein